MQKKMVIYYNNDELLYLIKKVKKIFNAEICTIIKTGERAQQKEYDGISIIEIEKFNENKSIQCDNAIILSESPFVNKMYYDLYKCGFVNVYTLNSEYLTLYEDYELKKIFTKFNLNEKPLIGYLETHVYNQCNLNCKGCTHFSNIDNRKIVSLVEYEKNMRLLSKNFNINTLRLMGGEPLLNEGLGDYIKITRKYFPNSNIDIATNGLLLCSMNEELIKTINENKIIIKISLYKPIEIIKEKLEKFLNQNNIKHFYGNGCKQIDNTLLIKDFHKCLTLNPNNDEIYNSKNCFARECWFLEETKIAKCATIFLTETLNKTYNTNFKIDKNDYIDLKNIKSANWDNIKQLISPTRFCKYCVSKEQKFVWETRKDNQQLDDYVILEGEDENEK